MAEHSETITLRVDDLPAFRSAIIACAHPAERERCERLLGQLASLEAGALSTTLRFIPGRSTAPLARRAFDHLRRAQRLNGRRSEG